MARPKEPRCFINAPEPEGRRCRRLEWYRSLFVSDKALCGENSASYAADPSILGVRAQIARAATAFGQITGYS